MTLTLDQARSIVAGALAHAASHKLRPLCVVVLDAGGHPVAVERQDGAAHGRFDVARAKAAGAVAMGLSSRRLGEAATERPHFMTGVIGTLGGAVVPVPGGVLIAGAGGAVIGAVGISGDTSDHDESAAIAGVRAAGLAVID